MHIRTNKLLPLLGFTTLITGSTARSQETPAPTKEQITYEATLRHLLLAQSEFNHLSFDAKDIYKAHKHLFEALSRTPQFTKWKPAKQVMAASKHNMALLSPHRQPKLSTYERVLIELPKERNNLAFLIITWEKWKTSHAEVKSPFVQRINTLEEQARIPLIRYFIQEKQLGLLQTQTDYLTEFHEVLTSKTGITPAQAERLRKLINELPQETYIKIPVRNMLNETPITIAQTIHFTPPITIDLHAKDGFSRINQFVSGGRIFSGKGHDFRVLGPDGKVLTTGTLNRNMSEAPEVCGNRIGIFTMAEVFSPDSANYGIEVFDVLPDGSCKRVGEVVSHDLISEFMFSASGEEILYRNLVDSTKIYRYNLRENKQTLEITAKDPVVSFAVAPNGNIAFLTLNGELCLADSSGNILSQVNSIPSSQLLNPSIKISSQGDIAWIMNGNLTIRRSDRTVTSRPGLSLESIEFSPSGNTIIAMSQGSALGIDTRSGKPKWNLDVTAPKFTIQGNSMVVIDSDSTQLVDNLDTGNIVAIALHPDISVIKGFIFIPNDKLLIMGADSIQEATIIPNTK